MENYEVADILKETAKLMELHNENSFKVKSYQNASFKLDRLTEKISSLSLSELEKVDGIGKSLSTKLFHLFETGKFEELEILESKTPSGVLDMMKLKGIGPKKVALLWNDLGIESLGELEYACLENRLIELKGFGTKTQQAIIDAISFKKANIGFFRYADVDQFIASTFPELYKNNNICMFVGAYRRKLEVLASLDLICINENLEAVNQQLVANNYQKIDSQADELLLEIYEHPNQIKIHLYISEKTNYWSNVFKLTGSTSHLEILQGNHTQHSNQLNSEEEIYKHYNSQYIIPEWREGTKEFEWIKTDKQNRLITYEHLKGILHNHTNYSDGINSLEEMAEYCRSMGMEYLGICDHSKSAGYANGLSVERVKIQHNHIDELNKKMFPFKIFKGIESDILTEGGLDYDDDILASFDFIVASVHSVLKMDEERATKRLIKAIEHPATTILGHPTGRLLLGRPGYPIDHKKVIDACASNLVAIELNANPYRLDIDWRWIDYALTKQVMISINPDAHITAGYHDMHYGVYAARKGGLTQDMTLNALSKEEIEVYFSKKTK